MNMHASQLDPDCLQPRTPAPTPALRRLTVGVVGPGRVGSALLEQLRAARERLRREQHIDVHLRVVADSRRMWLDSDDDALNARHGGAQTWRPSSLDDVAACLHGAPGAVIVDCSASEAVAARYADWLAAGLHVVTPNKLAPSGPLPHWRALQDLARTQRVQLRYEATVGAGLPVVQTLRDLLDTGDELIALEGMLSGTLAWLCDAYDGQRPFSALVREAHELGYTEPDPRADLDGLDVARKLVILARESGRGLSLDDVSVQSLVPDALRHVDREHFMDHLHLLDAPMAARHAEAAAQGAVLRHVGRLDADGRAHVGLVALPAGHAFAQARGADNIVQFHTRRYADTPLRVQGPGAGPDVTAGGVFTDLLRVAAEARA
ncbi:aspartokinase/homoserine dehydrogenase 1 [Oleiagrimonas soli]|uniref:Homoserine dehydrogenase n=2 Tax=Oleiagrimonas soli TaxID=1543381 RepID=A0A841KIQ6_9GAMM|nr:aspartokinase/homoserine dehydrogenase 1 [Oleiagrimonas soli]